MSVRQAQQRWLEGLYAKYHHPRYIEDDPLAFLARWPGVADREVGGLVAALLAFGNVKSIRGGIADLLDRVGPEPRRFVERSSGDDIAAACRGFGYRWVGERQMAALLVGVRGVLAEYGSLAGAFGVSPRGATIDRLGTWVDRIARAADEPLTMLLPRPDRGSACKRLWLYLRWMVRCDEIDPGGWSCLSPAELIVPLDTHMHAIGLALGWTKRRQATRAAALEVTEALRGHAPSDPLRYDFALTRPGIRREALPVVPGGVNVCGPVQSTEGAFTT